MKIRSNFAIFSMILKQDLTSAIRRRGEYFYPLIFFILIIMLFSLGTQHYPDILPKIGPAVIWVGALLVSLLTLEHLFKQDMEQGVIEQLLLSPYPPSVMILAKIIAHWLLTGLPMIILCPLFMMFLSVPNAYIMPLCLTLLLGTPILSLIGAIALALVVGLKRGGLLLALITLPLFVPILVISMGAIKHFADGIPALPNYLTLVALLILWLVLAPMLSGAALRISLR